MKFKAEDIKNSVEDILHSYITEPDQFSSLLEKAESYSILDGGKRLRPCILLAVCQMLGGSINDAMPFAAALEFIHTYSLIHDDLPAMDNDDMRRGKPSSHKAFGEDIAILSGDALLTRAFEIMSKEIALDMVQGKALAMNVIVKSAYEMVRGQVADIKSSKDVDSAYIEYVDNYKTAALFRAAFTAGAYLANADEEVVEDMEMLGTNFGMAFQLYDDFLDYDTDDCLNYAVLFGKENALNKIKEYMDNFISILDRYEYNSEIKKICFLEF